MLNPFTPGQTVSLAVSATTSRVALPALSGNQVRVVNPAGGQIAFIKFGSSTVEAAVTDMPILPGTTQIFTLPAQTTGGLNVAGITASSTATVYFTAGDGQ